MGGKIKRLNKDEKIVGKVPIELLFSCEFSSLKLSSFVIENRHIIEAWKLPSKLVLKFASKSKSFPKP